MIVVLLIAMTYTRLPWRRLPIDTRVLRHEAVTEPAPDVVSPTDTAQRQAVPGA
ncbi:hypothetical protein I553_10007 [Mycobacterium xenopi 4042]|uniref:Uncharacterized protein n=1 Tax=Mycobacterium xenopi 4042 TaxID=1299334 RepID=X7YRB7_MYCXE|nr:hypothetical protein I553_10007 [Mycobacterium xenopi 4042]